MRAFVVLLCFLATAYSASFGGYDYERNSGVGAVGGFDGSAGTTGGFQQGGSTGGSYNGGSTGGSYNGGSTGGSYNGGSTGGSYNGGSQTAPAEYSKEFFTYSAPEGEFNDAGANDQLANSLKKSLRVIFIKGPESTGLEDAALQLAKSAGDDRTAIYVLNKQTDISDLANKLNQLNNNNANKPEVHFVKYRTQADAENAQRTIQSQYDGLGGQSVNHDGGVAPVLDFASKGPVSSAHQGGASAGPVGNSGSGYLPPNRRF